MKSYGDLNILISSKLTMFRGLVLCSIWSFIRIRILNIKGNDTLLKNERKDGTTSMILCQDGAERNVLHLWE